MVKETSAIGSAIRYGQMIKFSHTLFALPFAGISLVLGILRLGNHMENLYTVMGLILVCMVSARSAAMGFNRIVDADLDAQNPRTKNREIPSGSISKKAAWIFTFLFSFVFLFASYYINSLAFIFSFPTLLLLFFYSVSKRITFLCHFILGISIGLAPTATWVALLARFDWIPILWTLGLAFNLAGFDILYAIQDVEVDRSLNLYSVPARFGIPKSRWIALVSHLLSLVFLFLAGIESQLSWGFYLTFLLTAFLLFAENIISRKAGAKLLPPRFYQIHSYVSLILFAGVLFDNWRDLILFFGSYVS